jgi:L-asparaginase
MPSPTPHVLVVATGGTIAGRAASAAAHTGYQAGALGVQALLDAVPPLAGVPLQALQLAQIDSKDSGPALWQPLVAALRDALARDAVQGIVVTHGTDTLEETAFLLQRVLAPAKPVVLTAAMRPATALAADGPQNLLDAVTLARAPGARGVLVAVAGRVHAGDAVRKVDAYRPDAFCSAPAGPLALIEDGQVVPLHPWPRAAAAAPPPATLADAVCATPPGDWPRVAWITSHAGFDPALVDAAVAAGFQGLVLAGTGNGSLHHALEAAARRAQAAGLVLALSTRCASGRLVGAAPRDWPVLDAPGPAQARLALVLELLARRSGADPGGPGRAGRPGRDGQATT